MESLEMRRIIILLMTTANEVWASTSHNIDNSNTIYRGRQAGLLVLRVNVKWL